MKKIKLTPPKPRAHSVLYARDLPFQPKTEASRVVYRRQAKHRHKQLDTKFI